MNLVKIPTYAYSLAEEFAEEVVNSTNKNLVLKNLVLAETIKSYFFNHLKFDFIIKEVPSFKARAELFALNYLTLNISINEPVDLILGIFELEQEASDKVFIAKKIFKSTLAPDILFFIEKRTPETCLIKGFITKAELSSYLVVSSLHSYSFKAKYLKNLNLLEQDLTTLKPLHRKVEVEVNSGFESLLKTYEETLKHNKIPQDFIYEVAYLEEENFETLLTSEELSAYYLKLQVQLEEVAQATKIIPFKDPETLLQKLFLYNKTLKPTFRHFASAAGESNLKVQSFTFELLTQEVTSLSIPIEVNIFPEENMLTFKGLETYVGKPWLLFIDLTCNTLANLGLTKPEEIFLNWTNEEFLNKNAELLNRFCYRAGAFEETSVIDEYGYLDLKIEGLVSSDMCLFLGIII